MGFEFCFLSAECPLYLLKLRKILLNKSKKEKNGSPSSEIYTKNQLIGTGKFFSLISNNMNSIMLMIQQSSVKKWSSRQSAHHER